MSIKYFCDVCDTDMTEERNYAVGWYCPTLGDFSAQVKILYKDNEFEGSLCWDCLMKLLDAGMEVK